MPPSPPGSVLFLAEGVGRTFLMRFFNVWLQIGKHCHFLRRKEPFGRFATLQPSLAGGIIEL
jgi:hypothetical protein